MSFHPSRIEFAAKAPSANGAIKAPCGPIKAAKGANAPIVAENAELVLLAPDEREPKNPIPPRAAASARDAASPAPIANAGTETGAVAATPLPAAEAADAAPGSNPATLGTKEANEPA